MKRIIYILMLGCLSLLSLDAAAQVDKREVRKGNRFFKKENFKEAEIEYRKALVKDSLSLAGNYNLASTLYREGDFAGSQQALDRIKEVAPESESAADYYFNLGDAALQQQNYQAAVDAFKQSLIRRPEDLMAKENYIYAKKKLENQQQNQDQNQQNQDQNQDQDQQDQNNDQNNDQNQDKQNQNNDQNNQSQQQPPQNNQSQQEPKISPQAAQQLLQAIQAKEKETQDKVNEKKAEALKSRQKEKNW